MRACRVVLIILLWVSAAVAQLPQHVFPIDGYNAFATGQSAGPVEVGLSYTGGVPDDPFYTLPDTAGGPSPLLSGRVQLGAETGDPLLNAFTENRPEPNRDHRSFMGGEVRHPHAPLMVAVRYRYIDDYTDRFDSLWGRYGDITGTAMHNEAMGVDYEALGLVRWEGMRVDDAVTVNPFGRWHATPYFFSPLLEEGVTVGNRLSCRITDRLSIASSHEFTRSHWFYDHQNGKPVVDNVSENRLSYHMNDRVVIDADVNYSSFHDPSFFCGTGGGYHDSLIDVGATAYLYGDGTPAGIATVAVNLPKALRCSTAVARDYHCKEREYDFLQNDTVVSYRTAGVARTTLYFDLAWKSAAVLPVAAEGWIAYASRPVLETVDVSGDTVVIRQDGDAGMVRSIAGVNGELCFSRGGVRAFVRPGAAVPLGSRDDVRFFCAAFADAGCAWSSGGKNPFSASLQLHYNSAPQLMYPIIGRDNQRSTDVFTAEVCTVGSLSLRIPFLFMPLRRLMSSLAFVLDAGPLPLDGESRIQVHPRGNRFGPEIYAGVAGSIR